MKVYIPPARRPRIEMVPLIDSFFLLLAFFMSSVLSMEVVRGLPVELPKAGAVPTLSKESHLVVTVSHSGAMEMEGEPVTLEELQARLVSDPKLSSLRVGIRADRETPYERVVELLAAVRGAGVGRVILLASSDETKEIHR